ncbi:protein FAM110B-like [Macrosteles quadrilineatus]|nr:protein FAM110B-like isoform X2 [Macrosteles quadrilineatus]XP_054275949.1 protein FAM110B-like isoform X2 [Macrosteles quadrilineatus]XP_054289585.1 protein FAM110B-like [Macrosteles quadrilineatus]XP_054289586.1 protein FAM110B-like [Macrosteles quadrilineatus]
MAATSMRTHSHTPLQTINRGNYFMRPLRSSVPGKHKSAVELLQESKCLYVKSEVVLDQRQQLKSSSPDNIHSPFVKVRGSSHPTSAQLRRSYNSATSTDQLQAKLRRLLNADSKENLIEDTCVKEEVRRSPQHYQRSNSHKPTQQHARHNHMCPVQHKSLPDLHAATSSGSDSSEPASCEYVLYTNNRKCSSSRQSTNDEISVESSNSRSKPLSSQRSSKSSHSGSCRHGLVLASPVKSSVSYGGSAGKMENRRPEPLWDETDPEADDTARLRPILRSKSDVGHRYTKLTPPPPTPANLDTFFEQLGLNSADFHVISKPSSQTSSPVFFSDTSSVDSFCATNQSYGGSEGAAGSSGELPSIVERNARIIKWLCNCRKAQLSLPAKGVS